MKDCLFLSTYKETDLFLKKAKNIKFFNGLREKLDVNTLQICMFHYKTLLYNILFQHL